MTMSACARDVCVCTVYLSGIQTKSIFDLLRIEFNFQFITSTFSLMADNIFKSSHLTLGIYSSISRYPAIHPSISLSIHLSRGSP